MPSSSCRPVCSGLMPASRLRSCCSPRLLPAEKIGPRAKLNGDEQAKNNLPDIAARWAQRHDTEHRRLRTAQSFCVQKAEIAAAGYDLSINRYKKVVHETAEHRSPQEIIAELKTLEQE